MTKSLKMDYPSIVDIVALNGHFMLNNQGIDTIQLIAKYTTIEKMADKLGLTIKELPKGHKLHAKIADEVKRDKTKRLKVAKFRPIVEFLELPKVNPKDKAFYISIVRNTPLLFDVATTRKTAKDSYCMVTFAGLHQPSKKISSEAMKIVSKFLKRKSFKVCRIENAIDTIDHTPINKEGSKAFESALMPWSKRGVNLEKTSYYLNYVKHGSMTKINFYDKYVKQRYDQGKTMITNDLKGWKRLEISFTFDVTKPKSLSFMDYIESLDFVDDLCDMQDVASKANIKTYDTDYLIYQVNSLLDNRFMNNHESKEQFNSVQSLERFKFSDFRRYSLAI